MHHSIRMTWLILLATSTTPAAATAAEVKAAIAANFTEPAREIAALFEQDTGDQLVMSFGATGQLYAGITQGAPFEVFLAADAATPAKAVAEGHAILGTNFTYAIGRLVLYSRTEGIVAGMETLGKARFDKLAIANPGAAPYGAAAVEVMHKLGVWDGLQGQIVQGQNVTQTLQFVETGNAELGFVALAQVVKTQGGSRWVIPEELHQPILQNAVLLKAGEGHAAARAFLKFLRSPGARAVIERFGYHTAG